MRRAIPKIQTGDPDLNRIQDNILAALNPLLRESASVGVPTGTVLPYAGAEAPAGYLLCNGAAVSRSAHPALYVAIGIAYGSGDGTSTFNVPDLRSRVAIGAGQGAGLTSRSRGAAGGEETHTLTADEMPAHQHHTYWWSQAGAGAAAAAIGDATNNDGLTTDWGTDAQGGGAAHNNMPPFVALNFIIKT